MERRKQTRYGLRVPVGFRWWDKEGILHEGRGHARDITAKGIFIYSDSRPPDRARVQIQIFFPALSTMRPALQMTAKARVVRVQPPTGHDQRGGFAVVSRSYILRNGALKREG